jgi:protoporphyrinogen oxidase
LEKIPVATWLRRWAGRGAFEKIWLPLLNAKLGDTYRQTSAAFIWAHINRMYKARRTGMKKEMFGYVPGGYARILDTLAGVLIDEDVDIRCGSPVEQVVSTGDGRVAVTFADGRQEVFDRLIFTTPAPLVARCCPELTDDEATRFRGIDYLGIVCASLLLKKSLSPYYVTNITDDWVPLTAVIEMTTIVDPHELGGHHLVYLPKYVPADSEAFRMSDDEFEATCLDTLERMYPHFSRDDVVAFRVSRARQVMALPTLRYSEKLPPMQTSIPGVYAINSAHILKGNLNVNETVQIAEDAIRGVLQPELSGPTSIADAPDLEGPNWHDEQVDHQLVARPG